jgi:hypothetical protein
VGGFISFGDAASLSCFRFGKLLLRRESGPKVALKEFYSVPFYVTGPNIQIAKIVSVGPTRARAYNCFEDAWLTALQYRNSPRDFEFVDWPADYSHEGPAADIDIAMENQPGWLAMDCGNILNKRKPAFEIFSGDHPIEIDDRIPRLVNLGKREGQVWREYALRNNVKTVTDVG